VSAPKPYRVAFIGCSAQKLDHAAPARELYTGALFKRALEYAELVSDKVFVLSAGNGVVALDKELEPYDARLRPENSKRWGHEVSRSLVSNGTLDQARDHEVLFLAGETYFAPLDFPGTSEWVRPLKGLGIGQQKMKLKNLIWAARESLEALILRIDAQLYVPGPDEAVGEVAIDAEDWARVVELARKAAEVGACSCGAKFYSREAIDAHADECPLEAQ
jgi:hypothetical protein